MLKTKMSKTFEDDRLKSENELEMQGISINVMRINMVKESAGVNL